MAKVSKSTIPLKMYKHFAVVTLCLTASIAMFADSDNRNAMAQHIDERQQDAEFRRASAEQFGAPRLVERPPEPVQGSFGDEGGGYGAPTTTVSGSSSIGNYEPRTVRSGRPLIPGYDQAYLDSLSEAEYDELLQTLPEETRASANAENRAQQIADLQRDSARRSGRRGAVEPL